ncbi:tetratricopeptide repeat protein [Allorhizobium pseudoryzae]|uniref:tetratricopeptide repeat protein n=1 Tax=Allorhizobium pseudoryzae TaxID=379684 RepID=UPI003CFED9B5
MPITLVTVSALWVIVSAPAFSEDLMRECDRLAGSNFDLDLGSPGVPIKEVDGPRAKEACEVALREHPEVPRLAFQLGRSELQLGNPQRAMELYKTAASQGYVLAETGIGYLYDNGLGVPQDYKLAYAHYSKAADAGIGLGYNNIASLTKEGLGVEKDDAKALALYEKAIAAGYRDAAYPAARLKMMGFTPGDDPQPIIAAFRAAANHVAEAQTDLGQFYRDGSFGMPKDAVAARAHYAAGAERGDIWGKLFIAQMDAFGPEADAASKSRARDVLDELSRSEDKALQASAKALLATLLIDTQVDEASSLINAAVETQPDNPSVLSARAALLAKHGDYAAADALLLKASEADPVWGPYFQQRAEVQTKLGNTTLAGQLDAKARTAPMGGYFLR